MKHDNWIAQCNNWKNKWPVYDPTLHDRCPNGIDIYYVLEQINLNLTIDDIIIVDAGSPSYTGPTNLKAVTSDQFVFSPSQADMGWAIPASIGVAMASTNKHIIVIVGDGSFYSNMQELAVIKHHNLPINIFVLNNDGYLSIRNTQSKYHGNRIWGVDSNSGLTFPRLSKISTAFDFDYKYISYCEDLKTDCNKLMHSNNPSIIEIMCKRQQEILPAQSFKVLPNGTKLQSPLHDMAPFLSDEELNMEWQNNQK